MASFSKHGEGWRAQVARRGVRRSKVLPSKGAATAWAGQLEAEIMAGVRGEVPNLTVGALFDRYRREVTPTKKGKRWEDIRLEALQRDRLAQVRLRDLDSPHVAEWQERRLRAVSGASVRRERNTLNNAFEIARKEWRWLRRNPFEGVRRPRDSKPRSRLASAAEQAKLLEHASPALGRVITIALETGMRAGEIPRAHVKGRVAFLMDTKNGQFREVPLSKLAVEKFEGGVNLTANSISVLFSQLCDKAGIDGLTFHDLRATAATRLARVLHPLQLAKMFGWKDLKQAMVYYRESASDVAKLL